MIRQVRGEIDCKAPGIQLVRNKAMQRLQSTPKHEFLHMKREWNQSAGQLARSALRQDTGTIVTSDLAMQDSVLLNQLDESIGPEKADRVIKIAAVT